MIGRQEGLGKELWPKRFEYEGEYNNGVKNGLGKLTLLEGSCYKGLFCNNQN